MTEPLGDDDRTVPVSPPVHVETFATHATVTWKAGSLARFLDGLGSLDSIPPAASTVVDETSTGGRERHPLTGVDASETVQYLRVEPDAPWTLSWERRTWPVVSVSGTPPPALCRGLHVQTTDCEEWSGNAVRTLADAIAGQ